MGWIARHLFAIPDKALSFTSRGFAEGSDETVRQLEAVGFAFRSGYHVALEGGDLDTTVSRLESTSAEHTGFAFEGAAMAFGLMDAVAPRRRRIQTFLEHPAGQRHVYMIHVGFGWALAKFPKRLARLVDQLDPLLRWLAYDGFGFHDGYFSPHRTARLRKLPKRLSGYQRRAFDQGLGRSLWFIEAADATRIARTIDTFAQQRRPDLWSGIGLASAYAGGVPESTYASLRRASAKYRRAVAQGAAFAAEARVRAGILSRHTDLACQEYCCGISARQASMIARGARESLPDETRVGAYEDWRQATGAELVGEKR